MSGSGRYLRTIQDAVLLTSLFFTLSVAIPFVYQQDVTLTITRSSVLAMLGKAAAPGS